MGSLLLEQPQPKTGTPVESTSRAHLEIRSLRQAKAHAVLWTGFSKMGLRDSLAFALQ
jgi:hypothetical protein